MEEALSLSPSDVEERIIDELKNSTAELHTEEIAERVGLVRHTASKYLQILQAKNLVQVRKVGNAKLWSDPVRNLFIRNLILDDLASILALEEAVEVSNGDDSPVRLGAFEATARYVIEQENSAYGLGAEADGKLLGFIMGEVRAWQFGCGGQVGWIEAISVAPDFQGRGIGNLLGEELLKRFARAGIDRVRTLVDWHNGELLSYFKSFDFDTISMIPLELNLDQDMPSMEEVS